MLGKVDLTDSRLILNYDADKTLPYNPEKLQARSISMSWSSRPNPEDRVNRKPDEQTKKKDQKRNKT